MAVALHLRAARLVKHLTLAIFSLLALLILLLATLWWWAGTDGSLAAAWRWADNYAPQRTKNLTLENPSGSLRAGGRVASVLWQQDGLTVDARDVSVSWQAWALASGTLKLNNLTAASVRVADRRAQTSASESPAPPESLRLPVRVVLDAFAIEQVNIAGATAFSASSIKGRYSFDNNRHDLQLAGLKVAAGSYSISTS